MRTFSPLFPVELPALVAQIKAEMRMGTGRFTAMTFAEQTLVRITQKIRHEFSGGGGIARGIFCRKRRWSAEGAIFSSAAARRAFQLFCLECRAARQEHHAGQRLSGKRPAFHRTAKPGLVFLFVSAPQERPSCFRRQALPREALLVFSMPCLPGRR